MRKTNVQDIAEQLAEAKLDISALESDYKAKVKPFEAKVEVLEGELLAELKRMPPKTRVATMVGVSFERSVRTTFDVVDEKAAFSFAIKNGLLRLDKTATNKKLLRTVTVPAGFEKKESEYVSVSGLKKKKEEAD